MKVQHIGWASLVAGLLAGTATGQTVTLQTAQTVGGLEEVVVTARRVREDLQKVPVSITALSSETLEGRQIGTGTDLNKVVPSLRVSTPNGRGSEYFWLRGLGPAISGDPNVAVTVQSYMDEAPGSSTLGTYFDLEGIQVLKGPQGTLFGRNTTGGAVLFESRKPTEKFEGYLEGSYGNHDRRQVLFAINTPIIADKVLFRIAGDIFRRDGYTRNIRHNQMLDSRNYESFRASLTVKLSDSLKNTVTYEQSRTDAPGSQLTTFIDPNYAIAPGFTFSVLFGAQQIADQLATLRACYPRCSANGSVPQSSNLRNRRVLNNTTYELNDNLTLKNIFSYRYYLKNERASSDGSIFNILEGVNTVVRDKNITEELQIQGQSFDDKLKWVAGGYMERRDPIGLNARLLQFYGGLSRQSVYPLTYLRSQALFGQGTYDLGDMLEGLKVTAGVRHTWDKRRQVSRQSVGLNYAFTGVCGTVGAPGFGIVQVSDPSCWLHYSSKFKALTYTLGLDYQITPDTLLYVTSRRGYKSGGFNAIAPTSQFAAFGPENVTDAEIGMKTQGRAGDMNYRLNIAGYYDWYRDIQLTSPFVLNGVATTATLNSGKAEINGLEVEGSIAPNEWIRFDANYSLTNAYFTKVPPGTNLQGFSQSPRHMLGLSGHVTVPVGENHGTVVASISYSWRSGAWLTTARANTDIRLTPVGTADASINWRDVGGYPIDVGFFVTNLTDKVYIQDGFPGPQLLGFTSKVIGEPRMYGVRARYSWGS